MDDEEMKKYCQQVTKLSAMKVIRSITVGSAMEIPDQPYQFSLYPIHGERSIDVDRIITKFDRCVFPLRHTLPERCECLAFRIHSHGLHSGYVKLFNVQNNTALQFSDIAGDTRGIRCGPAVKFSFASIIQYDAEACPEVANWTGTNHNLAPMSDLAYSVHSPRWPMEANEWITRTRPNGLPSKATIKRVVCYGCDFVQVSHKLSICFDSSDWRFSFSVAELILVLDWIASQRIVYRTLHWFNKILKDCNRDSVLCSYYIKTLMLWATEEKPAEFWYEDVIRNSVFELLAELARWLNKRVCPNYFIRSNNMMDHLTEADFLFDIHTLFILMQNTEYICEHLALCKHVDLFSRSHIYSIEAPVWLFTSLTVSEQEQEHNNDNMSTSLFSQKIPALLQHAISVQFSRMYNGLKYHKTASCCTTPFNLNPYFFKSLNNLGFNSIDTFEMQNMTLQSCSSYLAQGLQVWFEQYKLIDLNKSYSFPMQSFMTTCDKQNVLHSNDRAKNYKCLLFSRLMMGEDNPMRSEYRYAHIRNDNATSMVVYVENKVRNTWMKYYYKQRIGMSESVNISWFLSKAYLANLYYTTKYDYIATDETCDNIICTYKLSYRNKQFAEQLLPVILSTEWTPVFDEDLQAMLGLYSLCSLTFCKTDRSRSVCHGVCPVQFVLYLKCCCAADQLHLNVYNQCINNFEEHLHVGECIIDSKLPTGGLALCTRLKIIAKKNGWCNGRDSERDSVSLRVYES